jgi:catechol 2,3-dioxygenase-like lactoylglutathione lyase family enzyme
MSLPSGEMDETDVGAAHHVALRVANIETSARFYVEGFGARRRTSPRLYEGPAAEVIMGGRRGVRFQVCHIQIGRGLIELFEFLSPLIPPRAIEPFEGRIIHFGIRVTDVGSTLDRLEQIGGRRLSPAIRSIGDIKLIYVADLDDNVIEITDGSMDNIIDTIQKIDRSLP